MKKLTLTTFALTLVAGACASTAGDAVAQGKKQFIAIGTGGPTGVYFVTGNAICRSVHRAAAEGRKSGRKHGIRCSAPSTGGSTYNINNIMTGDLDFGVAQSDWQFHAYNGSSKYEGKAVKKLRAVFSVHPEPIQIIVGKGVDIDGWDDLKGKKVNIGNPGSGQRGTADFLIKKSGWDKDKDLKLATELTSSEQSKALCDGKIDAFFYTVGVPNAGVSVATDGCGAKIANFNGALAKSMVTKDQPYYAWATIPKGTYKTTTSDVTTWGVKATFITSADVPENVVYEVTRAVFENFEEFKKLHPAFENLDPKVMIKDGLSAPLHRGAAKYYKEKGWM